MRKWSIVAILLVLGLLAGGFSCAAPAPAPTPTPAPKPAPTTTAAPTTTVAPKPTAAPTTTAAPKPTTTAPAPTSAAPKPTEIRIAATNPGSSNLIIATAMAEMLNKYSKWLKANAQSTPGAIDALRILSQKKADIALSGDIEMANMANGTEYYEGEKYTGMRWMFPSLHTPVMIISKVGSKFKTLQDLKDAVVGVSPQGTAGEYAAKNLWKALGFQPKKILYYQFSELPSTMKDGTVDALYYGVGKGGAQAKEATTVNDAFHIPLDDATWKKVDALNKGFRRIVLPANTYRLQDKDVPTMGYYNFFIAREDTPDDIAYEMTKIFWDNLEEAKKLNVGVISGAKESTDMFLAQTTAGMHPGALKYFKEKGIIK